MLKQVNDLSLNEINYALALAQGFRKVTLFDNQVMVSNNPGCLHDWDPCGNWAHAKGIVIKHAIDIHAGDMVDALRKHVGTLYKQGVRIPAPYRLPSGKRG